MNQEQADRPLLEASDDEGEIELAESHVMEAVSANAAVDTTEPNGSSRKVSPLEVEKENEGGSECNNSYESAATSGEYDRRARLANLAAQQQAIDIEIASHDASFREPSKVQPGSESLEPTVSAGDMAVQGTNETSDLETGAIDYAEKKYFASGKNQDPQCICRCDGPTREERLGKIDRIVPCFSNAPLMCFRRRGDEERGIRGFEFRMGWLGTWRCCSRVGNFTVLLERLPLKSKTDADASSEKGDGGRDACGCGHNRLPRGGEDGAMERELWCLVGPYWPFCLVLTTNLIVIVPCGLALLFWSVIHIGALLFLLGLAGCVLAALAFTACRDPGILPHYTEEPSESVAAREEGSGRTGRHTSGGRQRWGWAYNDQISSWRPRGAVYDGDVNACIIGFDHVCPFTGTAIGRNNLTAFYFFTGGVNVLIWYAVGLGLYGVYKVATEGYTAPF